MDHVDMKTLVSWSGGKDSALALLELGRRFPDVRPVGLSTTVSEEFRRVSTHGVREELLEDQAEAVGLPLHKVVLPPIPREVHPDGNRATVAPNSVYEECMLRALARAKEQGVEAIAFGDIFLQDLRDYRDRLLERAGLRPIYPLWRQDTRELFGRFHREGFRAVTVAVNPERLAIEFLGRLLDEEFLRGYPTSADPCGENGEYHSFVSDGPIFRRPVLYSLGVQEFHHPYHYQELIPVDRSPDRRLPTLPLR
jgi:uncharacterized protein (TIGR00290 family)